MSSLFHFADVDSKSDTNHFVGFPALWNFVAFYVFAITPSTLWVGITVVGFVVLTFVPFHVVPPVRVKEWRAATLAVFASGCLVTISVLWTGLPANPALQLVLVAILIYFIVLIMRDHFGRA
jgi:phosphatidylcholine synthase